MEILLIKGVKAEVEAAETQPFQGVEMGSRRHPVGGVLDDQARGRFDRQPASRLQEHVGPGLGPFDQVSGGDHVEPLDQAPVAQVALDPQAPPELQGQAWARLSEMMGIPIPIMIQQSMGGVGVPQQSLLSNAGGMMGGMGGGSVEPSPA